MKTTGKRKFKLKTLVAAITSAFLASNASAQIIELNQSFGSWGFTNQFNPQVAITANDEVRVNNSGTLQVSSGTNEVDKVTIGLNTDNNILRVTGSLSTLNLSSTTTGFSAFGSNSGGVGTLQIINSGKVNFNNDPVFFGFFGSGNLEVDGSGSTLTSLDRIVVGSAGTDSDVLITNGGSVTVDRISIGADSGGEGSMIVDGTGSVFNTTQSGSSSDTFASSGQARVDITNGGVINSGNDVFVGANANSSGEVYVNGSGSQWNVTGELTLGNLSNSSGRLVIGAEQSQAATTPGVVTANQISFGQGSSIISFNHTDDAYDFSNDIDGEGVINLFSGTTRFSGARTNSGGSGFNIFGGTLWVGSNETITAGAINIDANPFTSEVGSLKIDVQDDNTYGKITVNNAILPSDLKIDVNVADPNFNFTTAATDGLADVISSPAGLTSDGTFTVTDNSALFNFSAVKDGNTVDLELERVLSVFDSNNAAGNFPGGESAKILDTIVLDPTLSSDPDWSEVINALGQQQTNENIANAVSQTLPLMTANATSVVSNAMSDVNRIVEARMDTNRGLSSGDAVLTNKHIWTKVYGTWHKQDDRDGVSGYDGTSTGLVIGYDGDFDSKTKLGLAFAYNQSSVDSNSNDAPNSANIDSYQFIGYGSYALENGSEINFQADLGFSNTDGKRTIKFISSEKIAKSDYDSKSLHLGIGYGKTFELNEDTIWAPSVRADYTLINSESYTEKGAGVLNLDVESNQHKAMEIGADIKLSHQVQDHTRFNANLGVTYDLINDESTATSSFVGGGAKFVTTGLKNNPWSGQLGLGLTRSLDNGAELSANYDLSGGEDRLNQTASVRVRWEF